MIRGRKLSILFGIFILVLIVFFIQYSFTGFFIGKFGVTIDGGVKVGYEEFIGGESTTDFVHLSDEELEDIENMTLENDYGKIVFDEMVNLTEGIVGNVVDLDANVGISFNFIEVNATGLVGLKKSATLTLNYLNVVSPEILRNGEVCPVEVCQIINFSGGVVIFSISNFTNYSNFSVGGVFATCGDGSCNGAESCSSCPADCGQCPSVPGGGGGGGGGGGTSIAPDKVANFELDKDLIKVVLDQGGNARSIIMINNTGDFDLDVEVEVDLLGDFLTVSDVNFILGVNESKKINVDFYAKATSVEDTYLGRIIFRTGKTEKVINVIFEIQEVSPLFDLKVDVINEKVKPGDRIRADFEIFNVGALRGIDILVYYAIRDFDGNVFGFAEESITIDESLEFSRKMTVPEDIEFGTYVLYAKISYGDVTATSADNFFVSERGAGLLGLIIYSSTAVLIFVISLIVVLVLMIIFLLLKRDRKEGDRFVVIKERYRRGDISKKTYLELKAKILNSDS